MGKFCYECNNVAGLSIGTCVGCNDTGKLWCTCKTCGKNEYKEESPDLMGKCQKCLAFGDKGKICTKCGDQSWRYE